MEIFPFPNYFIRNNFIYKYQGYIMSVISGPKGTRDFFPDDMAFQQHIFSIWHKTCKRYGFEFYDGPMFESLELYTRKSGDEIEKQLYTFEDKGQRLMALRPEMTPTLARMVASKGNNLKRPIRWYSIPRLFRYERMQKGRLREFFQLNMDILGVKDVSADAELIAAVVDMMLDMQFDSNDFSVRISSRTLLEGLFVNAGVPEEKLSQLYNLLDKKHKITPEEFSNELSNCITDQAQKELIEEILDIKTLEQAAAINPDIPALKDLQTLFSLLNSYGLAAYTSFDIGIVRGLAYYTGIVFEVFDKMRSMRAIAGGGRYDKLVGKYGGPDTPAVGFAAGDVVLGELFKQKFNLNDLQRRCDVFVVSFDNLNIGKTIETACAIRNSGISCEFSLKPTGVGKQMEQAHAAGSIMAVFIGGEEEKEGKIKLKIMQTGEEFLIDAKLLVENIQKLIYPTPPGLR
jgi:histidyl-tRNA synthetase